MPDEIPNQEISATSLKLPVFWPSDPEVWFSQVEAHFASRTITSDNTKYYHLVASLTPETACEVRDLLINPPAADRYATLKAAIVQRLTTSKQARLKQLLQSEELDGRQPSKFLRRMRQLVGSDTALVSDDLLRELFVTRLPNSVQLVLKTQTVDLDALAALADQMMDAIGPQVHAVNDSLSEIADLKKEIQEIKGLLRGRSDTKESSSTRARSKTPGSRVDNRQVPGDTCWFHAKFGANARKCREPCAFSSGNDKGSH